MYVGVTGFLGFFLVLCIVARSAHRCTSPRQFAKIRVKNREPVPVYAMEMDPHDRDSDIGDDSPMVSGINDL